MIKIYRYYNSDLKFNKNETMMKSWEKNYSKKIYEFMSNSENNDNKDLKSVTAKDGTNLFAIRDSKLFDIPFSFNDVTQKDVYTELIEMLECIREVPLRYKGINIDKIEYSFEMYELKRMYSWICNHYSHIVYSTIHVIFNTWLSSIYGMSLTNAAYVTGEVCDLDYFVLLPSYVAAIYNSDWGFSSKNNKLMTLSKFIHIAKNKAEYVWLGILTTLRQYATYFEWDAENIYNIEINEQYYDNMLNGTKHLISASKKDIMKIFKDFVVYAARYNRNRNMVLSSIRNDIKSNKVIKFIIKEENKDITKIYFKKVKSPSSYAVYMDSSNTDTIKNDSEEMACTITFENSKTYKDVILKAYTEGQRILSKHNDKIKDMIKDNKANKTKGDVIDSIQEENIFDDILNNAHEDAVEDDVKENSECDMQDSEYIDFLEKKVAKLSSELESLMNENASLLNNKKRLTETLRTMINDFSKNAKRYYYCTFGDKDVDAVLESYINNTIVLEDNTNTANSNGG